MLTGGPGGPGGRGRGALMGDGPQRMGGPSGPGDLDFRERGPGMCQIMAKSLH